KTTDYYQYYAGKKTELEHKSGLTDKTVATILALDFLRPTVFSTCLTPVIHSSAVGPYDILYIS
ncbi:MAG: hypothetical protein JW763_09650, partial [candidate division Zixibacteria bacterium]|nr:hypothetical protein [candidate division Zixibacteria bacterium]